MNADQRKWRQIRISAGLWWPLPYNHSTWRRTPYLAERPALPDVGRAPVDLDPLDLLHLQLSSRQLLPRGLQFLAQRLVPSLQPLGVLHLLADHVVSGAQRLVVALQGFILLSPGLVAYAARCKSFPVNLDKYWTNVASYIKSLNFSLGLRLGLG